MNEFEVHDPEFRRLVLPNAPLVKLGEGFSWLEGPVWFADADVLLVSDLPENRIMRWVEGTGLSVFRKPSGFANGHTRDTAGRLLSCSHAGRCITRTELDGRVTVLASHFEGRRLNSPNDIVCRSDGTIWFTDPHYGISTDYEGGKARPDLPPTLYRLDPHDGDLRPMGGAFEGPNGLCFSPDERILYVAESGHQFTEAPVRHILAYDVLEDGVQLAPGRIFHVVSPGFADGIRCDEDGRVWTSAADGVHCIAPDGRLLGRIKVPFTVSNLEFGGRNRARLFICASHTLYAIYTNTRGATRPPAAGR